MDAIAQKIEKLKKYFEERSDVSMAFLFGSRAKGYSRNISDWDVGVYLTGENDETEHRIWGDIEKLLQSEVDMVVLNRAPASIAWTILRAGQNLVVKDRKLYLKFMLKVSSEAIDWYQTAHEYHRIFERSASLSDEDRAHLERALQFLVIESQDYGRFKKLSWPEYENERPKRREVERWVEQLVNAVIDTAKVILASERRVIPETYREIVRMLSLVPPFGDDGLSENFSRYVDLRNILAHEYLDYRWKEINGFINNTEALTAKFIASFKDYLKN